MAYVAVWRVPVALERVEKPIVLATWILADVCRAILFDADQPEVVVEEVLVRKMVPDVG